MSDFGSSEPAIVGGLPPPPGTTPNFVNPESRHRQTVAALGVCLTFTTFFVWTRLYSVFFIIRSHGWADYCSFISWLGFVAYTSLLFDVNGHGLGVHQWNVKETDLERFAQVDLCASLET